MSQCFTVTFNPSHSAPPLCGDTTSHASLHLQLPLLKTALPSKYALCQGPMTFFFLLSHHCRAKFCILSPTLPSSILTSYGQCWCSFPAFHNLCVHWAQSGSWPPWPAGTGQEQHGSVVSHYSRHARKRRVLALEFCRLSSYSIPINQLFFSCYSWDCTGWGIEKLQTFLKAPSELLIIQYCVLC